MGRFGDHIANIATARRTGAGDVTLTRGYNDNLSMYSLGLFRFQRNDWHGFDRSDIVAIGEETNMAMDTEVSPTEEPRTRPLPRRYTPEEVAAIIAKQGPKKYTSYETILGAGEHLWDSDEELEEFLKLIDGDGREGE